MPGQSSSARPPALALPRRERGTTIRQQQSGELYYADSGGPVFGPTGLSWSKGATADWAANYFSIAALSSNPGITATTTYAYDNNGNVIQVGTTTSYTYDYQNRLTQSAIWTDNATTMAPVLTLHNVNVPENQPVPASSLIVSTLDQYPVTEYAFWDGGSGGGHFTYNGASNRQVNGYTSAQAILVP